MGGHVLTRGFEERDRERIVALLREYETAIGVSLCFQNFAGELEGLPGDYAPPGGTLILAREVGDGRSSRLRGGAPRAGQAGDVRDEAPLRAGARRGAAGSGARWRLPRSPRRAASATRPCASIRCPA